MEFRSILSYLGTVLEAMGILSILPVFIAWIYGESPHTLFFITAIISFVLGIVLDRRFRKKELNISSAMVLASVSIVAVSFIGVIPFLWNVSPLDSLFESVSGFTTTGLTTVRPESLPFSLVFWRSLTQWAGGLGILVIFLYLVKSPGISSYYGRKPEADELKKKGFMTRAMLIYAGITFAGFLLMEGMTRGRVMDYVKSAETRLFWTLIIAFTVLLSFAMFDLGEPVRHALFQTVSALTTGGFTTVGSYSGLAMLLLIVLMMIGGFSASTAGGIKLVRAGIMGRSFPWIGKKVTLPQEAIVPL